MYRFLFVNRNLLCKMAGLWDLVKIFFLYSLCAKHQICIAKYRKTKIAIDIDGFCYKGFNIHIDAIFTTIASQ